MKNPTSYSRNERTIRVTLDDVDFERLCHVAHRMGSTPTQLAAESVVHVIDQLADYQMAEAE